MDVSQYLIYGVPAVTLVIALVKIARETGLPSKYAPAASLGLGIAAGMVMAHQNGDPWMAGIVAGATVGVSACGIYDVGKKATE